MIYVGKETRLTDELERQLMMQAIEEQFRFKPVASLKKFFAKTFASSGNAKTPSRSAVESAS